MAVAVPLRGSSLRRARATLRLSQSTAARALGVRQETISRWEQSPQPAIRRASTQPACELVEIASLLLDLYPDPEQRHTFLYRPQPGLGNRRPFDVLSERPPYGIHEVWQLLMRVAHGIPS
jgi:putative toxin-antitoxin system antitoxin component (TIGR02293 family)